MEGPPLGAAFLCRLSMSIVSGLTCERTMWLSGRYHPGQAPDNVREQPIRPGTAQNADHFATSSPFSALFTEVVCDVGARPPQTAAAPPPIGGGIARHGGPTRRRRASCRAKPPPPPSWSGGHRRVRRGWRVLEGVAARKAWPRCRGRRGPVQTNVARNFRRSFFETA